MSSPSILDAQRLVKIYRRGSSEIRPVDGLDLVVPEKQFLALMGPSGSGKSTLLHLLGGIDRPDSGSVSVGGRDLGGLGEHELCSFRAANVGFVFQSFNLVPVLTARENVELPLRLLSLSATRRRKQVDVALEIVGLADRADHLPTQLSGGQEQRVAIARALATDPKIVLADEPTGNLDEDSKEQLVGILRALASEQGKTIVMVTHDHAMAQRADRVLYFKKGRLSETNPRASAEAAS
jgi:putative ABC transport system ATP-binding protein